MWNTPSDVGTCVVTYTVILSSMVYNDFPNNKIAYSKFPCVEHSIAVSAKIMDTVSTPMTSQHKNPSPTCKFRCGKLKTVIF